MRHLPKLRTVVKPTIRMHEDQWDGTDYTLYSPRLEPRGPEALPPPLPKDEYSIGSVFKKEANIFAEYTGLYGFVAKSDYQGRSLHPAEHKNPRAGAIEALSRFSAASAPVSALIREGWDRVVSSFLPGNTSPGHARPSPIPPAIHAAALSGSLFLYIRMGSVFSFFDDHALIHHLD
jgi:hypothetical protein